jgi:hypothetical protein
MGSARTLADFRQKLAELFEDPDAVPPDEMNQWQTPPTDPHVGCLEGADIEPSCITFRSSLKRGEQQSSFLATLWRRFTSKSET